VAVGGTNGFFPDNVGGKPWSDSSLTAMGGESSQWSLSLLGYCTRLTKQTSGPPRTGGTTLGPPIPHSVVWPSSRFACGRNAESKWSGVCMRPGDTVLHVLHSRICRLNWLRRAFHGTILLTSHTCPSRLPRAHSRSLPSFIHGKAASPHLQNSLSRQLFKHVLTSSSPHTVIRWRRCASAPVACGLVW
jgi:hypothetical protein